MNEQCEAIVMSRGCSFGRSYRFELRVSVSDRDELCAEILLALGTVNGRDMLGVAVARWISANKRVEACTAHSRECASRDDDRTSCVNGLACWCPAIHELGENHIAQFSERQQRETE
jgi:succinate dehydrogenase/fumarate reductase flavoprotein subunit